MRIREEPRKKRVELRIIREWGNRWMTAEELRDRKINMDSASSL